jgi:MFS family permease
MGLGSVIIALSTGYNGTLLGLLVSGIGLGLIVPNLNVWLVTIVPAAIRGRAVGGLTTAIFLGQFISPILMQPVASRAGLASAFAVAGGVSLLLGLVLAALAFIQGIKPAEQEQLKAQSKEIS